MGLLELGLRLVDNSMEIHGNSGAFSSRGVQQEDLYGESLGGACVGSES
jgi:hypothetical protein